MAALAFLGASVGASVGAVAAPEVPDQLPDPTDIPPQVEVLDAGNEPRRALRLVLHKGDTFERVMSMRMDARVAMNGEKSPDIPTPTISMVVRGRINETDEAGNASYDAEFGEITIEGENLSPEMQAMFRAQLADIVGTRVSARISPRGIQSQAKVETRSINPQFLAMMESTRQSISQMSIPFPEEAIGVNGRWAVATEMKMNGLPLRQRYVYHVVAVSETDAVLRITAEQALATPDAKMENLPAGVEGVARSLTGAYTGRSRVGFNDVMPRAVSISGVSRAEMEMTAAGQKMPMAATYNVLMRLRTPADAMPDEEEPKADGRGDDANR